MRVCTLRQAPVAVLQKAPERMGMVSLEAPAERRGLAVPTGRMPECAVGARKGEQGKSLVIEIKARITPSTIEIDDGDDSAVVGDEMLLEIIERMLRRLAPGAVPAEPSRLTIGKCLPGDCPSAVRLCKRLAVEIDSLMKTAAGSIRAHLPPQWKGAFEQPVPKRH